MGTEHWSQFNIVSSGTLCHRGQTSKWIGGWSAPYEMVSKLVHHIRSWICTWTRRFGPPHQEKPEKHSQWAAAPFCTPAFIHTALGGRNILGVYFPANGVYFSATKSHRIVLQPINSTGPVLDQNTHYAVGQYIYFASLFVACGYTVTLLRSVCYTNWLHVYVLILLRCFALIF